MNPRAEVPRPWWLEITWDDKLTEKFYYSTQESRDQAHARYSRDPRVVHRLPGKSV